MDNSNELFYLIKWCVAWVSGAIGAVWSVNKGIDKYFEFKASQQQKLIEIVVQNMLKTNVNPTLDRLSDSIEKLNVALWDLKNRK